MDRTRPRQNLVLGAVLGLAALAACEAGVDDGACAPLELVPTLTVHISGDIPPGTDVTLACEEESQCTLLDQGVNEVTYMFPTQATSTTAILSAPPDETTWSTELPLTWQDVGDGCVAGSTASVTIDADSITEDSG